MPEDGQIVHIPSFDEFARSGVYFLHYCGEIVYVGQAVNVRKRISDHIGEGVKVFDAASFAPCSLGDLDQVENHYIVKFLPKYNNCALSRRAKDHYDVLGLSLPQAPFSASMMNASEASDFLGMTIDAFHVLLTHGRAPKSRLISRSRIRSWAARDLLDFAAANPDIVSKPPPQQTPAECSAAQGARVAMLQHAKLCRKAARANLVSRSVCRSQG